MSRSLVVISPDDDTDALAAVVKGINAEFADRGLLGNLDGMDASFLVALSEAVKNLGGTFHAEGDEFFVALGGAPLDAITNR